MVSLWHTDTLVEFNQQIYDGLLRREHIVSNEISKKYYDEEYYGFVLEKDEPSIHMKERYFVTTDNIKHLPFKVNKWFKFSHKSEVFRFVNKCTTCKIPSRKDLSFRQLVDFYADYSHSNLNQFKLSKIILLAAYFERLNIRIVSESSYGKDALVDILSILNGNVTNLYNATLAKLKFALNNDFIVINELGGLSKPERMALQVYLTQSGAYKPKFENNSRSVMGTKDVIDLRNKSHIIFHNTPNYYKSKGQMFFEEMFTKAILDRFPGLLFEGYVTEDFSTHDSIKKFPKNNIDLLKKFISSLNYYKENYIFSQKYTVPDEYWGFVDNEKQRSLRSFKIITKYISEYCSSEDEFKEWCKLLLNCKNNYKELVSNELLNATHEEAINDN